MKKGLLALLLLPTMIFASYFSDGIRAYKSGNYSKARKMFEKAINEEGAEQAHYFLGLLYLKGKGVKQNLSKAQRYLKKAVRFGNVRAKCYLAEARILNKNGDKKKILGLLKEGKANGADECKAVAAKYNIPL